MWWLQVRSARSGILFLVLSIAYQYYVDIYRYNNDLCFHVSLYNASSICTTSYINWFPNPAHRHFTARQKRSFLICHLQNRALIITSDPIDVSYTTNYELCGFLRISKESLQLKKKLIWTILKLDIISFTRQQTKKIFESLIAILSASTHSLVTSVTLTQ